MGTHCGINRTSTPIRTSTVARPSTIARTNPSRNCFKINDATRASPYTTPRTSTDTRNNSHRTSTFQNIFRSTIFNFPSTSKKEVDEKRKKIVEETKKQRKSFKKWQ